MYDKASWGWVNLRIIWHEHQWNRSFKKLGHWTRGPGHVGLDSWAWTLENQNGTDSQKVSENVVTLDEKLDLKLERPLKWWVSRLRSFLTTAELTLMKVDGGEMTITDKMSSTLHELVEDPVVDAFQVRYMATESAKRLCFILWWKTMSSKSYCIENLTPF